MGKTFDGKDKFFYGGDWNEELHDNNFCMDGLVYPDRTPHTGLKEHKNIARPIRASLIDAEKGLIELDNKLDYTNIQDGFVICYEVVTDGEIVDEGMLGEIDCPAKNKVQIELPVEINAVGNTFINLYYLQKEPAYLTPAGYEAGHDQLIICQDAASAKKIVEEVIEWEEGNTANAEIKVSESEKEIVLKGENFHYVFQRQLGTFSSLIRNQNQLLEKPIELNIWRAPMDNDMNIKPQWKRAGYDRARTKVYSTEWKADENGVTITAVYSMAAAYLQRILEGTMIWKVDKDGKITVTVNAERVQLTPYLCRKPLKPMPFLPRFGLRLFLPKAYDELAFFGYGPDESYIDKHRHSFLDIFASAIEDLHEDYIRPQENGSHYGCSGLGIVTSDGRKALISGESFSFNASRYTQEELAAKGHNFELEESGYTVLCLDGYMSGCGSNSCGPALAKQYQVNDDKMSMTFVIEIQ